MKLSTICKSLIATGAITTAATSMAAGGVWQSDNNAPKYQDWNLAGRPNVLIISMDDLGYGQLNFDDTSFKKAFLDHYFIPDRYNVNIDKAIAAAKQATPNLRALQNQGVMMKQAFVSHAVSGPSRTAFMTSKFPSRVGIYSNEDSEAGIPLQHKFLAHLFQNYGYDTSAIGKWHMSSLIKVPVPKEQRTRDYHDNRNQYATEPTQPQNRGFHYFFGFHGSGAAYYNSPALFEDRHHVKAEGYITDEFTQKALAQINSSKGTPFFMYLAFNAPHIPLEKHAPLKYRVFNTGNEEVDKYYEAIYAVDQSIGKIVQQLKANGQFDNTMIMFWSDNGAVVDSPLPQNGPFTKGNKGMTFNGGVHIPSFITWRDGLRPSVYDKMVGTIDYMPTALGAAGIPIPEEWAKTLDGVNLMPYLTGDKSGYPHQEMVWLQPRAFHWNKQNKEFWKRYDDYITYKAPDASQVIPSPYVETKSDLAYTVRDNQYTLHYYSKDNSYELYNQVTDPEETHNLINEKPTVAQHLKDFMKHYIQHEAATAVTDLNKQKVADLKKELNIPDNTPTTNKASVAPANSTPTK